MSGPNALETYLWTLVNLERAANGLAPLAYNTLLDDAAGNHNNWMLANNTFSHTGVNNSDPGTRIVNAGYNFTGGGAWAENIAWVTQGGAPGFADEVLQLHTNWMNSAGHRANILDPNLREIGVGLGGGSFQGSLAAYVGTEVFGTDYADGPFLLGFAIDDLDNDDRYDPGEGLAGITVTAVSNTGTTISTTTWEGGAYSLDLAAGTWTVTFSGSGIVTESFTVTLGAVNFQLNLIDPAHDSNIYGTEAGETLNGTSASDSIFGYGGADTINGLGDNDFLYGGNGNDTLNGDAGNDFLYGQNDNDTLNGGEGNDTLNGQAGADIMTGGNGNDTYFIDNVGDIVNEPIGTGVDTTDTVITSVNFRQDIMTSARGVEYITATGTGNITIIGMETFNVITGNSGNNYIAGYGGNDTINAGAGTDFVFGGDGRDLLTGGLGNDTFYYSFVADSGGTVNRRDTITDFGQTAGNDDVIDLRALDAISFNSGVQHFNWLDTGAFTGALGELRYFYDAVNNLTIIEGNTFGDTAPEFQLALQGNYALTAGAAGFGHDILIA
ncbi:MAG: CAP domain-containing protein [Hyphomicrobiaceae bacterium]